MFHDILLTLFPEDNTTTAITPSRSVTEVNEDDKEDNYQIDVDSLETYMIMWKKIAIIVMMDQSV